MAQSLMAALEEARTPINHGESLAGDSLTACIVRWARTDPDRVDALYAAAGFPAPDLASGGVKHRKTGVPARLLAAFRSQPVWTCPDLAASLGVPPNQIHVAVTRVRAAGARILFEPPSGGQPPRYRWVP